MKVKQGSPDGGLPCFGSSQIGVSGAVIRLLEGKNREIAASGTVIRLLEGKNREIAASGAVIWLLDI
ncbi:hypothetical protein [Cohnella lupini]|uniref:hypothetical protein n=1 Tax=Cohnella lupini TaxID=1294267 RepID=UPI000E25649D|nr:hypothetical protein [Cohnella lupini]